jgi:hypothetical protein
MITSKITPQLLVEIQQTYVRPRWGRDSCNGLTGNKCLTPMGSNIGITRYIPPR